MANANDLKGLAHNIAGAYDERMAAIASIKDGVSNLLSDFHKGREDMAAHLQQTFSDLKSILKNSQADLEKVEKKRIKHNHTDLKERLAEIKKGKAEVGNLLECFRDEIGDFKKECDDTAAAWHDIVTTMQAKRSRGISSAKKPNNNRLRRKGARG